MYCDIDFITKLNMIFFGKQKIKGFNLDKKKQGMDPFPHPTLFTQIWSRGSSPGL